MNHELAVTFAFLTVAIIAYTWFVAWMIYMQEEEYYDDLDDTEDEDKS
jgi:hypothetical protein